MESSQKNNIEVKKNNRLIISLKAARINVELSTTEAAKEIGVTTDTLYNYEAGKTIPNARVIKKMCALYGVTVDDIRI